jgi:large subunit ribosomal protein L24
MAAAKPHPRITKVAEIRRGDLVVVLTGKDAGKRGLVERLVRDQQGQKKTRTKYGSTVWQAMSPLSTTAVVVEGLNIAKRHTKPRQSSNTTDRTPKITQGGILDLAQPLSIGKVMVVCNHCDKPTRIGHRTLDNGRRVRVCRHCGEQLEARS